MENKYTRQMLQIFDVLPKDSYLLSNSTNKNISSSDFGAYRQARVEKLRELYEKHTPEIKNRWVLLKGVTDGRKAKRVETIIGEDISPFDLPDFEEQMPNWEDYINKHGESYELPY